MAASSVTGLHKNGAGSADGSNKGSERMTLGVGHLIGPRVHAANNVTLSGGVATVTLGQPLTGSEDGYNVHVTSESSGTTPWISAKTDDANGDFASFAIAGGSTDLIAWSVISHS